MVQLISTQSLINLVLILFALAISLSTSFPHQHRRSIRSLEYSNLIVNGTKCTNPKIRVEWRRLKDSDKKAWIDAVHCMHKSPSKFNNEYPATRHRYDDFVAYHISAAKGDPGTHNNGFFLPFHRYFLHIWENTLQEECGYKGPTPWWDWSLDSPDRGGQFNKSPIWDPVLGFGGNGRGAMDSTDDLHCVENGPWSQYNITMVHRKYDPGFNHCLQRDFDWELGERSGSPSMVLKGLLDYDLYANFSELDVPPWGNDRRTGGPHAIGHLAVGGEMSDLFTSTNDPLFWIHHGGIDNFWWRWQGRNKTRLKDIRRSVIENHVEGEPTQRDISVRVTTLNTTLAMVEEFAPVIPIKAIMDTLNEDGVGFLCYKYDSDSYD